MKRIPLTQNKYAIVDDADHAALAAHKWYARRSLAGVWYAVRKVNRRPVLMHRVIAQPTDGLCVDHINRDGLDNRRSNLRICTHAENMRNRKAQRNAASPYKGVFEERNRWRARIEANGRQHNLGLHDTQEAAALAYDEAARELHGAFARTNF